MTGSPGLAIVARALVWWIVHIGTEWHLHLVHIVRCEDESVFGLLSLYVGWAFERFGDEGCCNTFHYGSGCIWIRTSVKKIKSGQSERTKTEEAKNIYRPE
jgi:hypothetical protein